MVPGGTSGNQHPSSPLRDPEALLKTRDLARAMFKRFRSSKNPSTEEAKDASRKNATASEANSTVDRATLSLSHRPTRSLLVLPEASDSSLQSTSPNPSPPSLGLHVLHAPELCAIDIIFVHGLGGHSHKTWTRNQDPGLFWPRSWLPFEPDMGAVRTMTFGYNAGWKGQNKSISTMGDFAKDLLYEMRFAKDEYGNDLGIGSSPIIFVAHSMGGLVVKKAYMMGIHDENYKNVVASVSAIIFLSTPHRGSNLAKTLDRVLATTMQSSRSFISDLSKSSTALEELNEQFRHIAPSLSIWSFYETIATTIGPRKVMVLEKDSSILGYPSEISKPLHADHQSVCKYDSPSDVNYISIRNAIRSLVSMFRARTEEPQVESEPAATTTVDETLNLEDLFRNFATCEDDFSSLRQRWTPNTCGWFLKEQDVLSWLSDAGQSFVLWYTAPPASGKSVLSAFAVDRIREKGKKCQYFFFKHSEQEKTSTAAALKAIAMQMAKDVPQYGKVLSSLPKESLGLNSEDSILIWKNVIEKALALNSTTGTLYWIIDALDECEDPKHFTDCLKGLVGSSVTIRVLVFSRNIDSIAVAFDRLNQSVPVSRLEMTDQSRNGQDMEVLIDQELNHVRGDDNFRQDLKREILLRSSGNFLWTNLVLGEILSCHTEESIQEVLDEVPDDIFKLYQRMETSILKTTRKSNHLLIQALLEWSALAQRTFTLTEMSQALYPEFSRILDLRRTIQDTCGQFLQVNECGTIGILHHTAREYFMQTPESHFCIEERKTHYKLFKKTISSLERPDLRQDLSQSQHDLQSSQPFLFYSAVSWCYHLDKSAHRDSEVFDTLVTFFSSTFVLPWIHTLALVRRVDILVNAAIAVSAVVANMRKCDAPKNPTPRWLADLQLLEDWVADLIKLVGKFGRILVSAPDIIYNVVPALSPGQTAISKQSSKAGTSSIEILGLEEAHWNDNLGCLPLPLSVQAWSVCSGGRTLAVLGSTGVVCLWDSSSFMEMGSIDHQGPVTAMAINTSGTQLVTYGLTETKIFSIESKGLVYSIPNPLHTKALDIAFTEKDTKILVGGDDRMIRNAFCDRPNQQWQTVHPKLLNETAMNGTVTNSPTWLQFNGDKTLVGASYRGAPLSIWRLADGHCINKCRRANTLRIGGHRPSAKWFAVDRFTWNPITGHVLGVYRDGCVFKWHPFTDENIEVHKAADEIAASPNGKLFATSSSDGSVRIWNFDQFTVIYQLSSEDLVMGLAFSSNSRRFYDLRGGTVNAWEPDSMTRFNMDEVHLGDSNSEVRSSTASSKYSEEKLSAVEGITTLAVSPDGRSYCVGYEDGGVLLFRDDDPESMELLRFYNFLNVTHIQWSPDGRHVAAADLAGDIQIVSLDSAQSASPQSPHPDLGDLNFDQIFFSQDSNFLWINTERDCFVWSMVSKKIQSTLQLEPNHGRRWLPHPSERTLILHVGPCDAVVYDWVGLQMKQTIHFEMKGLPAPGQQNKDTLGSAEVLDRRSKNSKARVHRVIACQDEAHILLDLVNREVEARSQESLWLSESASWGLTGSKGLTMWHLPHQVAFNVHKVLGVLPGLKVVFLDRDLWVCIFVPGGSTAIGDLYQRYYFIPRDWVGGHSLKECVLKPDGTFFWPRNDKVLKIRCDFDFARPITVLQ